MSSSSPRRSSRLAAVALAALAGALLLARPAMAASTLSVVAVEPGDAEVTMIVGVDPPPSLAQPGTFEVASGDSGKLPTQAEPVLGPQLATATVLDTSAAGAADLQNGINGSTNLLLQLPDGVRNLVVADGGDAPRTLSPLAQGATEAVAALNSARAGGSRHTAAALDAAVAGLPPEAGQSRLVLLYTGAPDAGGEPAEQLGRRLAQAGVVLAVVTTGPGQRYWSDAAGVTGGVVVPSTGAASLRPFDQAAAALRGRFVLTFPRPSTLPATVRVSMTVGGQTVSQSAVVPEVSAETTPRAASSSGRSWSPWLLGGLVLIALGAGGLVLARRFERAAPAADTTDTASTPVPLIDPEPAASEDVGRAQPAASEDRGRAQPAASEDQTRAQPGSSTAALPAVRDDDATDREAEQGAAVGDPAGPAGGSPLPRRRPGAAVARRRGWSGPDEVTVELARPTRPASRQHPAADERAYARVDGETARVAAAVAAGRMEFRQAVAKIALAAPGRVDLLDRVIETERRMSGFQIGPTPPTDVTLKLLTTARQVVAGEVALVAPTGARVEQAASGLRLIHPDRTTREYRSANELARHLDLDSLAVDGPSNP